MKQTYIIIFLFLVLPVSLLAQGETTASISGTVIDDKSEKVFGANVIAEHTPSGTKYGTITNDAGQFRLPNLRVGGPYTIAISYLGYETKTETDINLSLGQDFHLNVVMGEEATALNAVQLIARKSSILNSNKTGSGRNISQRAINSVPQINRSINDFSKLLPQSNSADFAGFSGGALRSSSVTVDGTSFNNAYGLGGAGALVIGNAAGSEPISLDALSEIQISLSPYDVRQGGFTGANVNAVTRSGDNEFRGSIYSFFQNESLLGTKVKDVEVENSKFNSTQFGFRIGGPIIKNKLFFFANYERVTGTTPASNFIASDGGNTGDNVTRVLASDLTDLSQFLLTEYDYATGPYQGFSLESVSDKFLIKLDYNISDKHKLSMRYNQLEATSDQAPSNSTFFGAGNRFNNPNGMSYSNSGWERNTNVYSFVTELNSNFNSKFSNKFKVGYSSFPENRRVRGTLFPSVDVLQNGTTYMSFGSDLFSNNNKVNQQILQIQNDFSIFLNNHAITLGFNYQHYKFKNGFTPAWQGSFVFSSLQDFYNSTPLGTQTPIGVSDGTGRPSTYARRYSGLENREVVFAEPKFSQSSFYVQDKFDVSDNFRVVGGLRLDITSFLNEPRKNPELEGLTFQNPNGDPLSLDNSLLPGTQVVLSPRLGFNWDVRGDKTFQVRGGTGIFNGIVPFVAIGDAFLNNGINQGEIRDFSFNGGTNDKPFTSDVNAYIPPFTGVRSQGDINFVDPDFKMPRVLKTTLGVDYQLPLGLVGSLELLYGKTIYDVLPINANLDHTDGSIDGVDDRFRFSNSRLNFPTASTAFVLRNSTQGSQFNFTAQLEKPFSDNWSALVAYTYGKAKDRTSFSGSGSRAAWRALPVVGNTNNPPLALSDGDQKHRVVGAASYKINYKKFGSSTFSIFLEGAQNRRFSYQYSGLVFQDANGDFVTNDLIFVPADASQINLADYTRSDGSVVTAAEQWTALDQFISNSDYLKTRRGQFAERNGSISPMFFKMDLRFVQDININIGKKKNSFQFTADILNFTNLLNKNWGVREIAANTRPIQVIRTPGGTTHRVEPNNLDKEFISDLSLNSRWRMQLGIRYSFN
ncbi:carboxypeptidase regulatory-like domain-containing protein [Tamlana sp. 2201CG12-4]|uniref:TonB-dependent receptor n=1 Tax=Tamlana sp. 2201CG12-4 TaxID=3112582 RepID=UPI002DBB02DE|nr:carboxypeptidase regulatory-like domain-containing protein [Tamlana sp. 2201CG12-4]MEC3906736.1 carboxypeptidase regulatory-like domain-containing protein [Tamlana sp. 2201CG12-4]